MESFSKLLKFGLSKKSQKKLAMDIMQKIILVDKINNTVFQVLLFGLSNSDHLEVIFDKVLCLTAEIDSDWKNTLGKG